MMKFDWLNIRRSVNRRAAGSGRGNDDEWRRGSARRKSGRAVPVWFALLTALFGVFMLPRANALPTFPPIVRTTYSVKSGGKVDKALTTCILCHAAAGPPALNPYGKDVKAALAEAGTKTLTPAILKAIDEKDSDGDGALNRAEFAGDSLPGDATVKPPPVPLIANAIAADKPDAAPSGGFNWRELLLPRHAQHPIIVHFPIALFIISLLFDVIALWKRSAAFHAAAHLNLAVAAISGLFALVTGILAWQFQYNGAALRGNLLYHLILSVIVTVLMWILWGLRSRRKSGGPPLSRAYLILGFLALVIVAITGHLGGILSGVVTG